MLSHKWVLGVLFIAQPFVASAEAGSLNCDPLEYAELKDMKNESVIAIYCRYEGIKQVSLNAYQRAREALRQLGGRSQAIEGIAAESSADYDQCSSELNKIERMVVARSLHPDCEKLLKKEK